MSKNQKEPEKKVAILEATLELIAECGFHNTPTSRIAKNANVGVGSIYRYFADKDELICELFLYVIEKENLEVLKEYNPNAPLREQYIHICSRIIKFALQHPKESTFLQQFRHSPYGKKVRTDEMLKNILDRNGKPPLIRLFETAVAQQVIKDLPLYILGALTLGPIFEVVRDIHSGIAPNDTALVQLAIEACWDALKR
jgi:AcrR family transcriptional regulator